MILYYKAKQKKKNFCSRPCILFQLHTTTVPKKSQKQIGTITPPKVALIPLTKCCDVTALKLHLGQWFLTCGEFPTGGEWRSCQVGNDQSDRRTTTLKFIILHPNVDSLYKSQPFTDCFNNKNNQYMRYCKLCLSKSNNTVGVTVRFIHTDLEISL